MVRVVRTIGSLVLLLAAALPAAPAPTPVLTPDGVLARVKREGAPKAAEELYASERSWTQVLRGVRAGSAAWLQVAKSLKPAQGPSAPDLTGAMADALAVAPERVLATLGHEFDADDVCSLNTLEDTLGESFSAAQRKVAARTKAVKGVRNPKLTAVRDECLGFLQELAAEVDRNREEWFPRP